MALFVALMVYAFGPVVRAMRLRVDHWDYKQLYQDPPIWTWERQ